MQFELIKLLTGSHAQGLFVVGDDDQSIYSFRGGSPKYVRLFSKHFGNNAKVYSVSHCRRCPPKVLKAALSIVEKFDTERSPKNKPTFLKTSEEPVKIFNFPTQEKEAEYIANICSKVTPSHDVLILVPGLTFAKPIIKALRQRRVGYDCRTTVTEQGFDKLDTLGEWLANSADSFSLRQIIHILFETDKYGVPSKDVKKHEKIALRDEMLFNVSKLWTYVINNKITLYESLKSNSANSDLILKLIESLDELILMYQKRRDNFLELIGGVLKPWKNPEAMFQEISTWIDEVKGRSSSSQGSVRIMTMHSAKGLESDYVFIIGLDDLVFPRANLQEGELEEASRMLYVSMTRTEIDLYLCHSRTRSSSMTYLINSYDLKPSQFISAIPNNLSKTIYIQAETKINTRAKKVRRAQN